MYSNSIADRLEHYSGTGIIPPWGNTKLARRVTKGGDTVRDLRHQCKRLNNTLKLLGSKDRYYIKCQGRGSRTDAKVMEYYSKRYPNISIRGAKYMAARSLPLEIAEIVDVYIYKRRS